MSLFLLHEYVVHAQAADEGVVPTGDIEAQAEEVEQELVEIEEQAPDPATTARDGTGVSAPRE
ncbi:MAG: hypothetical protein ACRD08_05805 [Acidimicrobiales bacterium]